MDFFPLIIDNSALRKRWSAITQCTLFARSSNTLPKVNLCALDLSKAFDILNYHALFITLMKRKLPVALLDLHENWLKTVFKC